MNKINNKAEELRKEYFRKYIQENKEKLQKYQKQWRQKNKDKVKQYNINYWKKKAQTELEKGGKQ